MSFKDTIDALGTEEAAAAKSDESFQKSGEEWEEILARRAALRPAPSDSDGDILTRITQLVRRHGPKYLGYPVLATAGTAAIMAEDGTFIGPGGIISLIGQLLGW